MNGFAKTAHVPLHEADAGMGRETNPGAQCDARADVELSFVANSPEMRRIYRQVELLADMKMPVLITGESGTGKHTVARLLHQLSTRAAFPFCELTCVGVPAEVLEQVLFGVAGDSNMPGKIGLCAQGTLYLDEITELPLSLQGRLLQFLTDEHSIRASAVSPEVPIRILAGAVDGEVTRVIRERRVREDFYYRLNAFTIALPPLRDRKEDIPSLLTTFMNRLSAFHRRPPLHFSPSTIATCVLYSWPGNLREMETFVRRYLFVGSEANALNALRGRSDFYRSQRVSELPVSLPAPQVKAATGLKSLIRNLKGETEVSAIRNALRQTNWNRRQAARLLNISYRSMLYKIREYGLQPAFPPVEPNVDADAQEGTHDPRTGNHS